MNHIKISLLSLGAILALTACKKNPEETSPVVVEPTEITTEATEATPVAFEPQSVNDELALKIQAYLNGSFLKPADLQAITAEEKTFQLHTIDLNNDGKQEVFVYLNSPYFCGSGGCTVLLLSDALQLITRFTVTRPPLFAESTEKNGWKVLSVQSGGEWKELTFDKGSYPSNPSLAAKATYEAATSTAKAIFSPSSTAKTYTF
ncbi:hypothetical protein [Flavobacterium sp. JP2137]|uniref:hypothetical protein n=1 Tax=Flavobacterium sp. JP2137 TaxID=3414510 RepID=UPI003D2FBC92